MAQIRTDLDGNAFAVNAIGDHVTLTAGATIPDGFWVGGHLVQDGDPADQTPPWAAKPGIITTVSWDEIADKPAVIAAGDDATEARDAISALAVDGKAESAAEADALATARTIEVSGAVAGTADFDGTADIVIETEATA